MAYASEHPYPPRYFQPPIPQRPANPEKQHITTLFVAGLPNDIKPREIHNLFCRRPSFDFCQLEYTGRGDQVVAFATFYSHHAAMAALNALNGVTFDPHTGATLHVELARSNSRRRTRGGGPYTIIDKRAKVKNMDQETSSNDGDGGSDEPQYEEDDSSNKDASAAAQRGESEAITQGASNGQPGDVRPCSTLFIANLGPTCTEEELTQVFSTYDGFQTLKLRGKSGMPVAFADFVDVEFATKAMNELQGTSLKSSDRGGMSLEYAKSKMRKV